MGSIRLIFQFSERDNVVFPSNNLLKNDNSEKTFIMHMMFSAAFGA